MYMHVLRYKGKKEGPGSVRANLFSVILRRCRRRRLLVVLSNLCCHRSVDLVETTHPRVLLGPILDVASDLERRLDGVDPDVRGVLAYAVLVLFGSRVRVQSPTVPGQRFACIFAFSARKSEESARNGRLGGGRRSFGLQRALYASACLRGLRASAGSAGTSLRCSGGGWEPLCSCHGGFVALDVLDSHCGVYLAGRRPHSRL